MSGDAKTKFAKTILKATRYLFAALFLCRPGAAQEAPYMSDAIPHDIYRAGEVRRSNTIFQDWRLSCDEVLRTRQRFCSIYGQPKNVSSDHRLTMVVSTSDNGQPAAVINFPLGVFLKGLTIKAADLKPLVRMNIVNCSQQGCMTIIPLYGKIIASLMAGKNLFIEFNMVNKTNLAAYPNLLEASTTVRYAISAAGFSEAINKSIH